MHWVQGLAVRPRPSSVPRQYEAGVHGSSSLLRRVTADVEYRVVVPRAIVLVGGRVPDLAHAPSQLHRVVSVVVAGEPGSTHGY